jgi:hypothetical protein
LALQLVEQMITILSLLSVGVLIEKGLLSCGCCVCQHTQKS